MEHILVKKGEKDRIPRPRSLPPAAPASGGEGKGGKQSGGKGSSKAYKQVPHPCCKDWLEKGDCELRLNCKKFHWKAEQVKQYHSLGPSTWSTPILRVVAVGAVAGVVDAGTSSDVSPGAGVRGGVVVFLGG